MFGEAGHGISKEYLIGAGVVGILLLVAMMTGGDGTTEIVTDNPKLDVKPDSPIAVETEEPERIAIVPIEEVGETGTYHPIANLPQKISSDRRMDVDLVNVRIENNILKFSVVRNDDSRFDAHYYHSVDYRVKVIAYRGEPWNREIDYVLLSDRLRLEKGQKEDIEGDFHIIEVQTNDLSSGKESSCEIRKIWFYLE